FLDRSTFFGINVYAQMINGFVAPGARGLAICAGGRLVKRTLSTSAMSPSSVCHMRSSTAFSTSSELLACAAACACAACWGAAAGGCAAGGCCAKRGAEQKKRTSARIRRNLITPLHLPVFRLARTL